MNKKGSTHVDWAISMGIFLTYVMSMFILIQPGIEPIQKNDQLIQIVENNFVKDVQVEMTKAPIKISGATGAATVTISDTLPFDGTKNHALYVKDKIYEATGSSTVLTFETPAVENIMYLLETGDFTFQTQSARGTVLELPQTPGVDGDGNPTSVPIYKLGVGERIIGTNTVSLNTLAQRCSNYNQVVQDWGFPINKRFSIRKFDGQNYQNLCHLEEPYEGANVFAKEIKIPILNQDSTIQGNAVINIRVW